MKRNLPRFSFVALAFFQSALAQGTFDVTFDGPPTIPPGAAYAITNYEEAGMSFKPLPGSHAFGRVAAGYPSDPQDGTTFLKAAFTYSVFFAFTNGSAFSLASVDLAEYSTGQPYPLTVHFVGYRFDGSIVTTDFTTDGIIDGTGPLADFQTFYFNPADWSGLQRVDVPGFGWSMDNLVVSVPEPGVWSLLALGAAIWAGSCSEGSQGEPSLLRKGDKAAQKLAWCRNLKLARFRSPSMRSVRSLRLGTKAMDSCNRRARKEHKELMVSSLGYRLYALTGYKSGSLDVYGLDPLTGEKQVGPIAIGSPAVSESNGFAVLPNGHFLINDGDAVGSQPVTTYREYDTSGQPLPGGTVIDLNRFGIYTAAGVALAPDGNSLYFIGQANFSDRFDTIVQTDLAGNLLSLSSIPVDPNYYPYPVDIEVVPKQ